jgi:predicted RNase H-like HicB family nuclease
VVFHEEEEGKLWAEVPAIPGCATEGDTQEELLDNLRDAIQSCLVVAPGDFKMHEPGTVREIEL